jgi:hypothetical protein
MRSRRSRCEADEERIGPLRAVAGTGREFGHHNNASIQMTADTYGHLFPRGDDGSELAAAERAFLAG